MTDNTYADITLIAESRIRTHLAAAQTARAAGDTTAAQSERAQALGVYGFWKQLAAGELDMFDDEKLHKLAFD